MKTLEELKRARRVGAPLVAIDTADQFATLDAIRAGLNGDAPVLAWDIVAGFRALNEPAKPWLSDLLSRKDPASFTGTGGVTEAMAEVLSLPNKSAFVMLNSARLFEDLAPIQAAMSLRDPFKANGRTLILIGIGFNLPPELATDVLIIDEPLPEPEEIAAIVDTLANDNEIKIDAETRERAIDALRGLASFPIEQAAALAVTRASKDADTTIDLGRLWERKRRAISQVKGLQMEKAAPTFDQMGGADQAKQFANDWFDGQLRPRVVVFIDEIEKCLAGSGASGAGDTSGTTQDQLQNLLTEMQDRGYHGMLCVGPGGSGKTMIARAAASTHNVPCVRLDLGAAKSSLVGSSEERIRAAFKSIYAMAGQEGAFFIATCNRLDSLPPELRRRFDAGIWFFDLPDASEREQIARVTAATYPAGDYDADAAASFFRACDGWSGANIATAMRMSWAMRVTLTEAARYVVPAAKQDPQGLAKLRQMAHGRFLSAGKTTGSDGTYQAPRGTDETAGPGNIIGVVVAAPTRRTIDVEPETPESDWKRNN